MPPTRSTTAPPRRNSLFVVAICFVTIVFDGYDLVVYGSTIPAILEHPEWQVTPQMAGAIGSYALMGTLIGTLVSGAITDIIGRRKILLASVAWFSLAMAASALSTSPEMLGTLRFVAGLGIGSVLPTAISLTVEYAPRDRRQLNNALMFSGFFVGGILTALAGLLVLPHLDFRVMYAVGALPLILVLPVAWRYLPESPAYLRARGRVTEAEELAHQYGFELPPDLATDEAPTAGHWVGIRTLFTRTNLVATALFALASFCGLLLIYGLNTWLPAIMRSAGFDLGGALSFLLALNIGGIAGTIAASRLADRLGVKPIAIGAFVIASLSILLLTFNMPLTLLLVCIAGAGAGTGGQILVNGYVSIFYPDNTRATALGWAIGVGRIGAILGPILGGLIAGSTLSFEWNLYLFAACPLLGALFLTAIPRPRGETNGAAKRQNSGLDMAR